MRLCVFALLALALAPARGVNEPFDTKSASFAMTFHDEISAYRDTAVVVMPGAGVVFNAAGEPPATTPHQRPLGRLQRASTSGGGPRRVAPAPI
jgi:hypothetical protein